MPAKQRSSSRVGTDNCHSALPLDACVLNVDLHVIRQCCLSARNVGGFAANVSRVVQVGESRSHKLIFQGHRAVGSVAEALSGGRVEARISQRRGGRSEASAASSLRVGNTDVAET